jgi:hypothetical protein
MGGYLAGKEQNLNRKSAVTAFLIGYHAAAAIGRQPRSSWQENC